MTRDQSRRFWRQKASEIAIAPADRYRVSDERRRCRSVTLAPEEMYLLACFAAVGALR